MVVESVNEKTPFVVEKQNKALVLQMSEYDFRLQFLSIYAMIAVMCMNKA